MATSDQPDLFSRGPAAPVDVAPESAAWASLASRLPPSLRLGTSSWSFPGWAGLVYDRAAPERVLAAEGLAAYARHPLLRTVGLDRTYYEPMSATALGSLARQVPADFRFVVKMDRRLTFAGDGPGADARRFLNAAWASDAVVGPTVEGLGDRLGSLLLQFPPLDPSLVGGPRRFAEKLYRFLHDLPRVAPCAVEIRTPALLTADYASALAHGGATHGYVAHPRMSPLPEQLALVPPAPGTATVVRWMLAPGESYRGARDAWHPFHRLQAPDPERRGQVAAVAREALTCRAAPMIVVNNKAEGSSPASVVELAKALVETEA